MSADVALLLQYHAPLDQLKNQCRDGGDCSHRPHNYNGTRAASLVQQCRLALPLHGSASESYGPSQQARALGRAWQNTSAMSSSVTFASPLSTPIHRKAELGVASPIDCHSDVSLL